jgi:hypothetical protein
LKKGRFTILEDDPTIYPHKEEEKNKAIPVTGREGP